MPEFMISQIVNVFVCFQPLQSIPGIFLPCSKSEKYVQISTGECDDSNKWEIC